MKLHASKVASLFLLLSSFAIGQTNPNIEQGIHAFGSYDVGTVDAVSLSNGGLTANIPLFSYPERGNFGISVNVLVTGKQWKVQEVCNPISYPDPCHVNWVGNNTNSGQLPSIHFGPYLIIDDGLPHLSSRHIIDHLNNGQPYTSDIYYSAVDTDGNTHQIGPNQANQGTGAGNGYSLDGSGITLTDYQSVNGYTSAFGIITRKGVTVDGYYRKDANGNINESPNTDLDTMGRSGIYSAFSNMSTISDSSGCGGSLTNTQILLLTFPGPNDSPSGSNRQVKLCIASITLNTKFATQITDDNGNIDTVSEMTGPASVIQSVVLYNGSSWPSSPAWTFEFSNFGGNNYGDVTKIILPTGGSIAYNWTTRAPACAASTLTPVSRWVTQRTAIANTGDPNQVSTYLYDDGVSPSFIPTAKIVDAHGNYTLHSFAGINGCSTYETKTEWHSVDGPTDNLIKTVSTDYSSTITNSGYVGDGTVVEFNILPIRKTTTLDNGQVSKTETDYDSSISLFGNSFSRGIVSQAREYAYGSGAPGPLIRCTQYSYKAFQDPSYLAANLLDLPTVKSTYNGSCGGTLASQASYGYDESALQPSGITSQRDVNPGIRGNRTSSSAWVNSPNGTINTSSSFYDTGMPYSSTDGKGNTTYFSYSPTYVGAYLTQTTLPPTGSVAHISSGTYDFNTGLLTSYTDQNAQTSSYVYDGLGRMLSASYPDGGGVGLNYPNFETVQETRALDSSRSLMSQTIYDGLGRVVHKSDPSGNTVDTTYNPLGEVASVSNPHGSSPADGTTAYSYDALGRKTVQTQPDGNTLRWSYTGNCVTSTDEASNSWTQCSDALGRLTSVLEPGGIPTSYGYDALSNLTNVTQSGVAGETPRIRGFVYDSLSRLTSATNPETGTINYSYDANGNVQTKTTPAPNSAPGSGQTVTTTYSYDALNRLTFYSSNDGTPNRIYAYDQTSFWMGPQYNTIGRLSESHTDTDTRYASSVPNPVSPYTWTEELYSYDAMGRITRIGSAFPSEAGHAAHETDLTYDLAGNMTSLRYPDSRVVTQGFDTGGHLQNVTYDNWNGQHIGYTYASGFTYTAAGAQNEVTYGNGVYIHTPYNNRQQMCQVWSNSTQGWIDTHIYYGGSTIYCNSTPGNNGNITQIKDWKNPDRTQGFSYDALNRLASFSNGDGSMQQSYSYDSFGNLSQSGTLNSQVGFDSNNRINTGGYAYDAAGNLAQINVAGITSTYAFDAASRIFNVNSGGGYYTYDGNGNRMRKDSGGSFTEYQYLNGQPIAEKHPDGTWSDYIYANGQKIARADSYDVRIHFTGTNCSNCGMVWSAYPFALPPYTVQEGDKIAWRQYQDGPAVPRGGLRVNFTDGTQTNWNVTDQNGQMGNDMSTQNQWVNRVMDLSGYAGKTMNTGAIQADMNTGGGNWEEWFADIALFRADGTVVPVYHRQRSVSYPLYTYGGVSNSTFEVNINPGEAVYPVTSTTYYIGDQLGSTRLTMSGGGWPMSSDTFYPFGQEQSATSDPNNYKFTGKERDAESGLDYFGARYMSSTMGRFMSPDWSARQEPVPYAKLENPQSLNLYSYVYNNPINGIDPDGHFAPQWHFLVSFIAAISVGQNPFSAAKLGVETAWVDSGTQGRDPAQANIHAMAGIGQDAHAAYLGTLGSIREDEEEGNMKQELHTLQDSHAEAHEGFQDWSDGYGGFGGYLKHQLGDWLPSLGRLWGAFKDSRKALKNPDASPESLLPDDPGSSSRTPARPAPSGESILGVHDESGEPTRKCNDGSRAAC